MITSIPTSKTLINLTNPDNRGYLELNGDDYKTFIQLMQIISQFVAIAHAHPTEGLKLLAQNYDEIATMLNQQESKNNIINYLVDASGLSIINPNEPTEELLHLYLYELFNTITYFAYRYNISLKETSAIFETNQYWEMLACQGRFYASLDPSEVNEILETV